VENVITHAISENLCTLVAWNRLCSGKDSVGLEAGAQCGVMDAIVGFCNNIPQHVEHIKFLLASSSLSRSSEQCQVQCPSVLPRSGYKISRGYTHAKKHTQWLDAAALNKLGLNFMNIIILLRTTLVSMLPSLSSYEDKSSYEHVFSKGLLKTKDRLK
jgi:hypothetical protein